MELAAKLASSINDDSTRDIEGQHHHDSTSCLHGDNDNNNDNTGDYKQVTTSLKTNNVSNNTDLCMIFIW